MSFGDYNNYANSAYNWIASWMPGKAVDSSDDQLFSRFYSIPSETDQTESVGKDIKSETEHIADNSIVDSSDDQLFSQFYSIPSEIDQTESVGKDTKSETEHIADNSIVDNSDDELLGQFHSIPLEPAQTESIGKDRKSETIRCFFLIREGNKNWSCCMENATMRKIIEKCAESLNVDEREIKIMTYDLSEFWDEADPNNEFRERGLIDLTNVDSVDEFLLKKSVSLSFLHRISMIEICFKKVDPGATWAPILTIENS